MRKSVKLSGIAEEGQVLKYHFGLTMWLEFVRNRCNLGYAFVNFTSVQATMRLYRDFHLQQWEEFNSRKVCHVTYARVQVGSVLAWWLLLVFSSTSCYWLFTVCFLSSWLSWLHCRDASLLRSTSRIRGLLVIQTTICLSYFGPQGMARTLHCLRLLQQFINQVVCWAILRRKSMGRGHAMEIEVVMTIRRGFLWIILVVLIRC